MGTFLGLGPTPILIPEEMGGERAVSSLSQQIASAELCLEVFRDGQCSFLLVTPSLESPLHPATGYGVGGARSLRNASATKGSIDGS
jgi:hypothetical protein